MLNFTYINFENLKNELGEKSAVQLLDNFYYSYESFSEKLNDNDEVKKYVHKLKGAAGNLKIDRIFNLCKEIESASDYSNLLIDLKGLLKNVLEEIKKNKQFFLINDSTLSYDGLKSAIDNLLVDIEEFNYIEDDDIEIIINSLIEHVKIENSLIAEFKTVFSQGDYDKLKQTVSKIKELI